MCRYPEIKVRLVGEDGNAYAIVGRVVQAMRRSGIAPLMIDAFRTEAYGGDYDNLLRTCLEWVSCDEFYDDEEDDEEEEENPSMFCGWCFELHADCECECEE
jgi:hypothetical protein